MWQALHTELEPAGVTVVTVALDSDPTLAHPWIDAAAPTHPSLIDRAHSLGPLLGFVNVPMAVWIDEQGVLVRPPEAANVQPNGLKLNCNPALRLLVLQEYWRNTAPVSCCMPTVAPLPVPLRSSGTGRATA